MSKFEGAWKILVASLLVLTFCANAQYRGDEAAVAPQTMKSLKAWLQEKVNIVEGRHQVVRAESGERCLGEGELTMSIEQGAYVTISLAHHVLSYGLGKKPYVNKELFQGCTIRVAVSETDAGFSILQSRSCGDSVLNTKQVISKMPSGFKLQNFRKKGDADWNMWISCLYQKVSDTVR